MRSIVVKSRLRKAKEELQTKSQTAASAFQEALRAPMGGREEKKAVRKYVAAEDAFETAEESFDMTAETSKRFSRCHTEAYERLRAAQKDAGSELETPMDFQFAETVPTITAPVKRSKSK